jgi:hypothetical protein
MIVKKLAICVALVASFALSAETTNNENDSKSRVTFVEELVAPQQEPKEVPWSLIGDYVAVGKASFKRPHSHHHFRFSQGKVLGTYTESQNNVSGLSGGVGYMNSTFTTTKHFPFHKKHFHNLLLNIGGFTRHIEQWNWSSSLELQTNTEHLSIARYTLFTGLLTGQYEWHKKRNLYAGVAFTTGMRYTRVLPVVGFDYRPNAKLTFNAVFPINISAVYALTDHVTVDLGLRLFLSRQRFGKERDAPKRGFVTYTNTGLEGGINYKYDDRITFNMFAGEAFGGILRISNRNDHHSHRYKQKPAPYVGLLARINL